MGEAYRREHVYPKQSLAELMNRHEFKAAIELKRITTRKNDAGEIDSIRAESEYGLSIGDLEILAAKLPQLRNLSLRNRRIVSAVHATFAKFKHLESLRLEYTGAGNPPDDDDLVFLQHLPELTSLSLDFNLGGGTVTGTGLRHAINCTNLERVTLNNTPVSDEGLKAIACFSKLKMLSIGIGSKVTDAGLRHLEQCQQLETIAVETDGTLVSDESVKSFAMIPSMKALFFDSSRITNGVKFTDACIDSLLNMPQLEYVSFADHMITHEGLKRLQTAGITVEFGLLKDFERSWNFLRYLDFDFEIDADRSALHAYLSVDDGTQRFYLEIDCTDDLVPHCWQPAFLEGPPLGFEAPWRELENTEFQVTYDEESVHPLLPGNPGNIYVGWHAFPNNHEIRFGNRRGRVFEIDWKCVAKGCIGLEGDDVWVKGDIEFKRVVVHSTQAIQEWEAKAATLRFFSEDDLLFTGEETEGGTRYHFNVDK